MNQMKSEAMQGTPAEVDQDTVAVVEDARPKPRRNVLRLFFMLVVPALLLLAGGYFWLTSGKTVSTDNAAVKQDIVSVAAQVNGPVVEVLVENGDRVKRGQLLFRIDPQPYRVALEQAQAQLAAARLQTRQLNTQAAGTGADIIGAQAQLEIDRRALARQNELLRQGFTTRAAHDDAVAEVRKSETELQDARARAANAQAAIAPGEQPSIALAQAAVDKARLDLSRTEVRATMDGIVANADRVQLGTAVVTGVGLMSIVHGSDAWVEANFKEKDLARMLPGEPATVEIDAYPDLKIKGHVESIGAGTGAQFSVIPAQNANGNWVKVTQRVPVRIKFDEVPKRPMIAGLSANVTVRLES
ncbi:HlyD family secretion protein [Sphingomonas piscis]|uniref:HlyD family secretion protein n=1 Tax=Sphingomonas piscis TaxID=2714943 RepID=A0A6G7YM18_9SPHN|nr:HlyD family secretion protein [Sphingomonas piscis]QIK77782.1 HlyD family secretion protein [Sphingomonas piscis]